MIFSKQKLDIAFTHMSKYYNKILLIDLDEDTFDPIKVNDREWQALTFLDKMTFSEWIAKFFDSPFYSGSGDHAQLVKSIFTLRDLEKLKKKKHPFSLEYKKIIDGEFHDVMMEYLPIEKGKGLLFVKDLYLMKKGIYENENEFGSVEEKL